ncbi:MAG: VOC family protein [Wenzhouxiangellaceae bacterium]
MASQRIALLSLVVRDYQAYRDRGVEFVRGPKTEPYGTVAVFRDLYGNLWDLLEAKAGA